jgi:guanine deaminase
MPGDLCGRTLRGTLIHTPILGEVSVLEDALVSVGSAGAIDNVIERQSPAWTPAFQAAQQADQLETLADSQYLLPGLVDLHIHAPQWPQLGKALHLPLAAWLREYTFPLEAKYEDLDFARGSYLSLVDNLLANGTTTAAYFGTIHLEATKLLADIAHEKGQRAVVGKVAMDNADQCPDYYRDESTAAGLDGTRALIEHVSGLADEGSQRVFPAITPRFIPSCTDEMLTELGRMADEYDCHIQTHCSESDWEHSYVLERHGIKDTDSLDRFGLLTDKTILAHSILINDEDMTTIRHRQCGIAHCPLSNLYFSHAVFPARKALDAGLKVGLGTDISGGPSPSILHNCQQAVSASRALEDGVNPRLAEDDRGSPGSRINFREAFWMATTGGAKVLGLKVGRFEPGNAFDAMVIDTQTPDSNLVTWESLDTADDVLQKIVNNADRHNIERVWVQGKLVKPAP